MEFIADYGLFLAKVITFVVAFALIVGIIASQKNNHNADKGQLEINPLNDQYDEISQAMNEALLDKAAKKAEAKRIKKEQKKKAKVSSSKDDLDAQADKRIFVVKFNGNISASAVTNLREEITAILTQAKSTDEVVVKLESSGGMVHSYGLAASQMMRIRNKGIPLTAIVDRVAASGGYLMAAVANKILAAPFAVIGSIGVVAQIPNLHRLLKKNDVDVEVLTAGKYKRTLTLLGENTDEGREKFREELEDVHALFQEFVAENRPELDIEAVATGEAWYGKRALELNLVDGLATSDEYLIELCETRDVFEVTWEETKKPIDRVLDKFNGMLDRVSHVLEFVRK